MKNKIKLTALFLSLTMGCGMIFASCTKEAGNGSNVTIGEQDKWEDGTHGGTETETENYVLKNGKSEYKIVLPETSQGMEEYAANELQTLFKESTGVLLPIVKDTAVTTADKFFSIGRTSLFADTGVVVDRFELKDDGFKLFTEGDDLYLCGGTATGTVYAVYEYLYRELNFEQFYAECYTLDTNVTDLTLKKYEIAERPDIAYRAASYGYQISDSTVRYRMRISGGYFSLFTAVEGQACHNSLDWLPLEKYYEEHPDWYSADKTQLCYTARGNEDSLNQMVDAALEKFKTIYASVPDMKAISLSISDYQTFCSCETCSQQNEIYGTDAAVCIKFLNKLSPKMEAYVTELHKDDPDFVYDIDLIFFAYNSTTNAPVTYDEKTDTYAPIDDSVVCDPHVAPWYAPIFMDYTYSIYDSANISYLRNMYGWDALSETMYLWTYETNFTSYMSPYDSFNGMQDLFMLMAEVNAAYLFNQSQWNQSKGGTAWHMLKAYLTANLSWDSTQNVNDLIDRYFNAMYGPAANTMKSWFNSYRAYSQKLHDEGKYKGSFSIYTSAVTSDFWSYPILRSWLNYSKQALAEVEKYKTIDPELYAKYYERIAMEKLSPAFLMLELYESRLSKMEAKELFDGIVADASLCGVTKITESNGSISTWANSKVLID